MDETQSQDIESESEDTSETNLDRQILEKNLHEGMKAERLLEIGATCKKGFEEDYMSREQWERDAKDWIKLAKQIREERNYPWPNSSNVKYPLLSTAAMQFSARAYPSLVPSNGQVVKAQVIGKDPHR